MDRNERNTMDQNARKRTVRREGNAAGSTRANEGLGRRPSGNGAPASAGRPSGKSSSASVRRTSESGDPTRRTTPGGTVTPMRRESGSVRKPSEQAGRAQGSLRKEHSETGRTRDTAGVPTDPSLRRAAGKAQGNPAEQKPVRSADGIVRKQGGHPNGKSKAMSKKKKKQKRAAFNFASGGVLIIAACVFIFSLYQLITMLIPYYSGGEE